MRNLTIPAALMAAFLMSACSYLQPAADVIARGIDEACERGMDPLAMEARRATVAAINSATTVGNHTASDFYYGEMQARRRRAPRWSVERALLSG